MVKEAVAPCFTLNDGRKIPAIGFGTYRLTQSDAQEIITFAVTEAGYRHIDCALFYLNEPEIGKALQKLISSGSVKREELFVTSKCWNDSHQRGQVMEACKKTLSDLGLNYVDLYLVHWPMAMKDNAKPVPTFSDVDYLETWQGMEDVHRAGLAKSIGVSNFNSQQLDRLLAHCSIKPVMNQIEIHPYLDQSNLINFCKSKGIMNTAYCPLGSPGRPSAIPGEPNLSTEPIIKQISKKYGKTWAQVALRYGYQQGVAVIPKSSNKTRIKENIEIFDFELTLEEMNSIAKLNKNLRIAAMLPTVNHPHYPFKIAF